MGRSDSSPREVPAAAARILVLTALAMLAFAGNSLLCRIALRETGIDATSFTTVRLVSGAIILWLIVRMRSGECSGRGNWPSAFALNAYAPGFSFAYVSLTAATVLLSVTVIAALGGIVFLGESLTLRLALASAAVLGGIALVMRAKRRPSAEPAR